MNRIAQEIRNTKDRAFRTSILDRMSKKNLAKLCKLLGLKCDGHAVELRSRIINCR